MCTAAKLGGEVTHLDHTNNLAVLLAEESHCALFLCSLDIGFLGYNGISRENILVNYSLNSLDLLRSESCEMREVKTANAIIYIGACLLNVVSKDATKRRLKQMSRRVISHNILTAHIRNISHYSIANSKATVNYCTEVITSVSDFVGS